MKRASLVLVSILVFAAVLPAIAQYADVANAWPYGVVVWIGGRPDDAAAITDELVTVTNDVFSFWELPAPVPGSDWATSVQTGSSTNGNFVGIVSGESIPASDSPDYASVAPSWEGKSVRPVIVDFYPDPKTMHLAWDNFALAGGFMSPLISTRNKSMPRLTLTTPPLTLPPGSYILRFNRGYDLITIARRPHWQQILRHELAHWLFSLWCAQHKLSIDSFPPVVREGFADYTRHSLSNDSGRWRKVAAVWAQHGGLADVPPPLVYDVGTSLIAYLVIRDGKEGFWHELPQLTTDWEKQAKLLTPGWKKWLSMVSISAGDRAMYEARLERLYGCALLLKPVLPPPAWDLVHRLDAGNGTMDDISQFWKIVRTALLTPRTDGWSDLIYRQDTLLMVALRDKDAPATIDRIQDLERKLKDVWYHWKEYRPLYVTGVMESVARWGQVPKEDK